MLLKEKSTIHPLIEGLNLKEIGEGLSLHYSPLTEDCKEALTRCAKINVIKKNKLIIKEGDFNDAVHYVLSGAIRVYYLKQEKEITEWFSFENCFFCALNCFFYDLPSLEYIETLEDSIILKIPKKEITSLCDTYPDFDRLLRIAITKTMLTFHERLVSIQFEEAAQRYCSLLKANPNITQRVPLKYIASYLGITMETLSRIRKTALKKTD